MDYTIIDIETTGLKWNEGDEITEIAGINVSDGEIIAAYSSLVYSDKILSEFIIDLTGIDNNMLKNAPDFNQVIKTLVFSLNINSTTKLVIHNAEFDYNFIKYYINKNCSQHYINLWDRINPICSLEFARKLISGSRKLEDLKKRFGIKTKSHRALNDCFVTKHIYENLIKIQKKGDK